MIQDIHMLRLCFALGLSLPLCGCSGADQTNQIQQPLQLGSVTAVDLVLGPNTACVLLSNGKAKCEGKNGPSFGMRLAGATFAPPTKTSDQENGGNGVNDGIVDGATIAMSEDAFCGLRRGGWITKKRKISCSGDVFKVPEGGGYKMIVAGKEHFCVIDKEDQLVCWGPNCLADIKSCWYARLRQGDDGKLDTENSSSLVLQPLPGVLFNKDENSLAKSNKFTELTIQKKILFVDVSEGTTCFVKEDGIIQCFGYGDQDVLVSPSKKSAVKVSVGDRTACAVLQDKKAACWGKIDPEPENKTQDLRCGTGYVCTKDTQEQWLCEGSTYGKGVKPIDDLPFHAAEKILHLDISPAEEEEIDITITTPTNATRKESETSPAEFFCKITKTNAKQVTCGGNGRPTKAKGMKEVPKKWSF